MEGAGNIGGTVYTVVNEAGVGSRVQVGIWHLACETETQPVRARFWSGLPKPTWGECREHARRMGCSS